MSVSNIANISSITIKSVCKTDERIQPVDFEPYNWLKTAKIYNKRWQQVPNDWIIENTDVIVLLFTARGVDRDHIMKKFYHIYESTKYVHIPIDVIFLPMDETEEDALACFREQANWFTLRFDDILVHTLKFMYGITSIPHLTVVNTNCELISFNGIAELDMYGKNAVISWLTLSATTKRQRRRSEDAQYYGPVWKFVKPEEKLPKYEYHRRFKADGEPVEDHKRFSGPSNLPDGNAGELFDGHFPRHSYLPELSQDKPAKDYSKPPEDQIPVRLSDAQIKPSENSAQLLERHSKSAESHAEPSDAHKPSVIQIKLPEEGTKSLESRNQFPEGLSKSVVTPAQPSGQSRSSESRVQLKEDNSKPSESQAQLPENRSKSATGQTSESNAELKGSRSKTAKSTKFLD